ncbi:hypothetical protein AAU61_06930 [Desulfocarbo indianensis]|nr:hypothetical protein AAU61_06930 [Desulfocarbo indianensis]
MSSGNNKKKLGMGLVMMAAFAVVLLLMFMPLFPGGKGGAKQNGLNYMDNLYNSISKDSAYYIPQVTKESEAYLGKPVTMELVMAANLALPAEKLAQNADLLLKGAGAQVQVQGDKLSVSGGLGKVIQGALKDADTMFHNKGEEVSKLYGGANAKEMLYTWWALLGAMEKSLQKQKLFSEALFVDRVKKKAVECAYNYYKIVPESIGERWGIVLFSLIFYVVYTMWYGYAVMFLFEGTGFRLEH